MKQSVPVKCCPCGSPQPLELCCGPYLGGQARPSTAAALMRSRYTAYVLLNEPYLLATWHPTTRPATLALQTGPPTQWLGLAVKFLCQLDESHATVEFVARYKINGRAYRLHENSRFVREDGFWFYLDGEVRE